MTTEIQTSITLRRMLFSGMTVRIVIPIGTTLKLIRTKRIHLKLSTESYQCIDTSS